MWSRIGQWINERWPISAVLRWGLQEEISGGARFAFSFGSITLFLFVVQVITGVWQLLYYVPTVDHAYDSVMYFRRQIAFGWLIHGLHYWAANAFIVMIGVHVARVFIWGAYKKPRELIWLAGVGLLVLAAALVFTGAALPWDELGYWAAEVGTSMAGTVPLIGDFLESLARGGATMGQMSLSRFFFLHVAILPGLTALLVVVHLVAFRQFGSVGPWDPVQRARSGWFWPDQILKDLLMIVLVLVVLIGLVAYVRAPITGPADPLDTSYSPKPEWNFLFVYQALKFFKGPWEPIGTVGIPAFLILLLVLLPFVDRAEQRHPLKRPVAMGAGAVWITTILALTYAGYRSKPGRVEAAPPAVGVTLSASAEKGRQLFQSVGCRACHTTSAGQGSTVGPDLALEAQKHRSRQWLIAQIKDPKSHVPTTMMPSYSDLGDQQINDLIDYLESFGPATDSVSAAEERTATPTAETDRLSAPSSDAVPSADASARPSRAKGDGVVTDPPSRRAERPPGLAATIVGNPAHGAVLYRQNCQHCHGVDGGDHIPNPGSKSRMVPGLRNLGPPLFDTDPEVFAKNVDQYLQYGAIPEGPAPELTMPAFGVRKDLTQQQIAELIAYILALNDVDRAEILHPGVKPEEFFWWSLVFCGLIVLGLGECQWYLWLRRHRPTSSATQPRPRP